MAIATCNMRVYDPAAEGYNSKEPWGEHDVLENSFWNYSSGMTTHPYWGIDWQDTTLVPEVGCVRPNLMEDYVDQTLADWTLTNGIWTLGEGILLMPNGADVLCQHYLETDQVWSAETVEDLPEDPRFLLMLWAYNRGNPGDVINSWITVTIADTFRIWCTTLGHNLFQRFYDGDWINVASFHWDIASTTIIPLLYWDPLAGGLSLYTWQKSRMCWGCTPDLSVKNVTVPEGKIKVEGCGVGIAALGLHSLYAPPGSFISTYRGTYEDRSGSFTIDVNTWSRYEGPALDVYVTGTDESSTAPPGNTQYSIVFTNRVLSAGTDENASFIDIYRISELYAVDIEQACTQVPALNWASPGNYFSLDDIRSITIEHTPEGGWTQPQTCRIEVPWSPHSTLTGDYRFRFCIVYLDDYRGGGLTEMFHGIITNFHFTEGKDGRLLVLELVNSTFFRAQRVKQERHWPVMGGLTDLAARNLWIQLIGLPTARGSWTTTGGLLPKGAPADPFGAPWEGNEAAELLNRIDWATQCLSYHDVTDGCVKNILRSAYSTVGSTVTFYKGKSAAIAGASDQWLCWDNLEVTDEGASDLMTRWKAVGATPSGDYVAARATDWAAERSTSADNFVGFPILQMVDGQFPGQSLAELAALAAYDSSNRAWRKVSFRSPGLKSAIPPMWVYINGSDRLGNSDPVRVLGVRHEFILGEYWTYYEGVSMVI